MFIFFVSFDRMMFEQSVIKYIIKSKIAGTSMQPALNPNSGSEDYVFLSKWAIRDMYVQRGDIISLTSPKDPNQKLIKRIVGLQGFYQS